MKKRRRRRRRWQRRSQEVNSSFPLSLESRKFEIQMQLLRIKKQQKTGFKLTQKKKWKSINPSLLPPTLSINLTLYIRPSLSLPQFLFLSTLSLSLPHPLFLLQSSLILPYSFSLSPTISTSLLLYLPPSHFISRCLSSSHRDIGNNLYYVSLSSLPHSISRCLSPSHTDIGNNLYYFSFQTHGRKMKQVFCRNSIWKSRNLYLLSLSFIFVLQENFPYLCLILHMQIGKMTKAVRRD